MNPKKELVWSLWLDTSNPLYALPYSPSSVSGLLASTGQFNSCQVTPSDDATVHRTQTAT